MAVLGNRALPLVERLFGLHQRQQQWARRQSSSSGGVDGDSATTTSAATTSTTSGNSNSTSNRRTKKKATEGYVRWYVDGEFRFGVRQSSLKEMGSRIPQEPSYVIINTAISTSWGFPNPPPGCTGMSSNSTRLHDSTCSSDRRATQVGSGNCTNTTPTHHGILVRFGPNFKKAHTYGRVLHPLSPLLSLSPSVAPPFRNLFFVPLHVPDSRTLHCPNPRSCSETRTTTTTWTGRHRW